MSDEISDAEKAVIEKAVSTLREHFDSVQIFVARDADGDGTFHGVRGSGDWFSRYGIVRTWLVQQDEVTRLQARKNQEAED